MDIDQIPIVGHLNKKVNAIVINFILLGIVCFILGILIPFFPQVLDILVAAMLIVISAIFFSIGYHIYSTKKKYTKWIKD